MLTKSYTLEQHAKKFGNKVVHVYGPVTLNERLQAFYNATSILEAISTLRIGGMSPQVIHYPASFNKAVKDLFDSYKNLSIEELLNKAFINCFDFEIYIDPTNLKGGLVLKFTGDGVNEPTPTAYCTSEYIKGDPLLRFESYGTGDGNGILIQEVLRSTLTGTDYKAFKDLKEVLKKSDLSYGPVPRFYKLSLDGVTTETLEKFHARRTKWLERYLPEFAVKRGADAFHLLQVRSTVGLPNPKVGMKVFKGKDEVTGVAFYLD